MNGHVSRLADNRKIARFVVVGVGAAALLFALSYLFVRLGAPPFIASTVAYAIAFSVAYTAQRNWTFRSRASHQRTLPRYFAVQAGCALLAGAISHVAVHVLGASPLVMAIVTTLAASAISFVLSSIWAFAPDD